MSDKTFNRLRIEKDYVVANLGVYAKFLKEKGTSLTETKKVVFKAMNDVIELHNIGSTEMVKEVDAAITEAYKPMQSGIEALIKQNLGLEDYPDYDKVVNKFSKTFGAVLSDSFESMR